MYKFIKIRHDINKQCHGNYRRWKISIISLILGFLEIPHKNIWVSWGVLFKGLGVQKGTQTPCWLRPWSRHNQRLHAWLPPSFFGMDAWMTCFHSQTMWVIDVLSLFLICYPWVFLHGTDVEWNRLIFW